MGKKRNGNVSAEDKGKLSTKASVIGALTRRDIANAMQVCVHTVRRWERAGKLKGIRVNARVVRYAPAELDRLMSVGV